jgi:hypothetical protein
MVILTIVYMFIILEKRKCIKKQDKKRKEMEKKRIEMLKIRNIQKVKKN